MLYIWFQRKKSPEQENDGVWILKWKKIQIMLNFIFINFTRVLKTYVVPTAQPVNLEEVT